MRAPRLVTLGDEHDSEALAINEACPIEADFHVVFDRNPTFFARPRRLFDDFVYRGTEVDGKLCGYGAVGFQNGWLPGGVGRFFYGGDVRVLPQHRRQGLAELLRQDLVQHIPAGVDLGWSVVQVGNQAVLSWQEKVGLLPEDPTPGWNGASMGAFVAHNVMFRGARRPPRHGRCRQAGVEDIEPVLELWREAFEDRLFAPSPDGKRLLASVSPQAPRSEGGPPDPPQYWLFERNGCLVASAGVWDMESMHQTRVLRMTPRAKLTRVLYQGMRCLYPSLEPLPTVGGCFRGLYLVDVAVRDRDPQALHGLLRGLLHAYRGRGYHFIHVGFLDSDPLRRAMRGLFSTSFRSDTYLWYRDRRSADLHTAPFADPYLDLAVL